MRKSNLPPPRLSNRASLFIAPRRASSSMDVARRGLLFVEVG